jgi:alkanesulfonate monooxygenase SsuD/methylene tetrahydromethanopterin reductase-like flavin-dependent oxidoreductase (luciferase family)
VGERERPRLGVNPTSIGVTPGWWLDAARRLEAAGFDGVYCWDHFLSRGRPETPVLECWTTLAAAAAVTSRLRLGSFVNNVMNRHPSVLARMTANVAALAPGRLDVGLGVGGSAAEAAALGIPFPEIAERVERLEEVAAVLRALWAGGPATYEGRWYRLTDAYAHPAPDPPPRIIVGGESPAGARLAARVGDGWTTTSAALGDLRSRFEDALAAAGRRREDVTVIVAVDLERGAAPGRDPLLADLRGEAERWRERGADELVVNWVRAEQLSAVLAAAEAAGLA